jgi:peptidoglycan/LPS O-acetylase OafA/YrhL
VGQYSMPMWVKIACSLTIPVILFHFGMTWVEGGYVGVDIFFVISGFLITSIILKDYQSGVFTLKDFWLRRIRRILPVLILVVIVTLIVGQHLLYAPDVSNLGSQGIASLLSFANINQWLQSGNYWGYTAENSPLLHTWSLSVEEQFYLFFPILILLSLRYCKQWLIPIVFVLSSISLLLFFYGSKNHPDATFYLVPTRAWELGTGALLGLLLFHKKIYVKSNQFLSCIGLVLVIGSFYFLNGDSGITQWLFIPVAGAALIILFSQSKDSWVNRLLVFKPIVYVGKISYSLYLWHWPVLVLSKNLTLKTGVQYSSIWLIALIVLLSVSSYHLIEVNTRRNTKITPFILIALFLGVVYSYTLNQSSSFEDASMYSNTRWDGEIYNVSPNQDSLEEMNKRRLNGILINNDQDRNAKAYAEGGIERKYGQDSPEILVLGDSHGLMWAPVLNEIAKDLKKSITFFAADGTPTFFNIPVKNSGKTIYFSAKQKLEYDTARLTYLDKWRPPIVFISQSWSNLESEESTVDLIKHLGEIGSKVYLIEQPPELFFGQKSTPQFLSYYGLKPVIEEVDNESKQYVKYLNTEAYQQGRKTIRKIVAGCNYCEVIPVADIFIRNDQGWVLDGKDVLYIDDDHLSYAGANKVRERMQKTLLSFYLEDK